jgi:predicted RNA-binding Zn ribbon-like protein
MPDPEFLLLGEPLWLEFVNTRAMPPVGTDALPDPAAYLRWTKAVQIESPGDATAFQAATAFRAKLLGVAEAFTEGRTIAPSAIEALNRMLGLLEGREQLVRIAGQWQLRFQPSRPPGALEAIALSAAQALANPLAQVRRCAAPECRLFFLDESANQSRRWCSRARCGQRGRYERRRTNRTPVVTDE